MQHTLSDSPAGLVTVLQVESGSVTAPAGVQCPTPILGSFLVGHFWYHRGLTKTIPAQYNDFYHLLLVTFYKAT